MTDRLEGDGVDVFDALQVSGLTPPDQGEGVTCSVDINPRSHYGSRGEAGDGHMWLEVEAAVAFFAYEDWMVANHATIEVDLGASITVVGDNGDTLPLDLGIRTASTPDGSLVSDPPAVATDTAVVEVPDTLREFTVTCRLAGVTLTAENGDVLEYQRYDHQNVGTIELTES